MLKPFVLISAAILFAIAPTTGSTFAMGGGGQDSAAKGAKPGKTDAAAAAATAALDKAKSVYGIDCAVCHGENGNGKTDLAKSMDLKLDDWSDPKTLAEKTDKQLFDTIRNGKDKMPPEGTARATDAEVNNLIVFIRSLSKAQPEAAPAAPAADAPKQ